MLFALALLAQAQLQPIQIAPSELAAHANQPQIAVDKNGVLWLAFGANDTIYVCSSEDNGRTVSSPVPVNEPSGKMSLGMRRGPRISTNKSRIVVSAIFGEKGGGKDGDLLAWRSSNGTKWDGPTMINDVPGSAREGLHAMGAGADDAFVAVWLDLQEKGTRLLGSYSTNGGRGWSKNAIVYKSPEETVCECCHPSLAFGAFGEVAAMFRNSLRGERDMYVAPSRDGGRTWTDASKLGSVTWEIAACPMDGGAAGFDNSGGIVSFSRSQDRIYLSRGLGSVEIAYGKNPWMSIAGSTPYLVWQSGNGVYFQVGTDVSSRLRVTEDGSDPVVIASKDGPVVAWMQRGAAPGIYVLRPPSK